MLHCTEPFIIVLSSSQCDLNNVERDIKHQTIVIIIIIWATPFKNVFWYMWTVKAQISLRICAVWSGPSLSTNRSIGYYRMFLNEKQLPGWDCTWAGWSNLHSLAHAGATFSIDMTLLYSRLYWKPLWGWNWWVCWCNLSRWNLFRWYWATLL